MEDEERGRTLRNVEVWKSRNVEVRKAGISAMRIAKCVLSVIALAAPGAAFSQENCATLREAKEKTYDFSPSQLDGKARKAKSDQMDAFWKLAEKQKAAAVPCLQKLLRDETGDGFFLFDGAALLFDLEKSKSSVEVVVESLQRVDLREVDDAGYLRLAMSLAQAEVDIGTLAGRYLRYSKERALVPQHSMTVDKHTAALFLYESMSLELADRALAAALNFEEPSARSAAARILAMHMTEASYRALSQLQGTSELSEVSRKEIEASRTYFQYKAPARPIKFTRREVLEHIRLIPRTEEEFRRALRRQQEYERQHPELLPPKNAKLEEVVDSMLRRMDETPPFTGIASHDRFIESAIATLTDADLPTLREARRKSIQGLSDETLYEYFAYTTIIRGIINRLDLYKEFRVH